MSTVAYPLPNALVIIIRTDGKFATWGYTDSEGKFKVNLPRGTYDIFVVGDGFAIHHQIEVIDKNRIKTVFMKPIAVKILSYVSAAYVYEHFEDFKLAMLNLLKTYPDLVQAYPNLFELAWAILRPAYGPTDLWVLRNIPPGLVTAYIDVDIPHKPQATTTLSFSVSVTEA